MGWRQKSHKEEVSEKVSPGDGGRQLGPLEVQSYWTSLKNLLPSF